MKRFARRDRMKIYGDILSVIYGEVGEKPKEKILITHIQLKTNVPFDRLKTYLSELKELGLIQDGYPFALTEKGQQFLYEYKKVIDLMRRLGLVYRE